MSTQIWRRAVTWAAASLAFLGLAAGADEAPAHGRQFPIGSLRSVEELPAGQLRLQLERLSGTGRQRALSWLNTFPFSEHDLESLQADAKGGIYYADPPPSNAPAVTAEAAPEVSQAAVPVSPFPASLVFHSRPGAPNVIYLNFTGENVSGTAWNDSVGRATIAALAFSTDADRTTFSDSEQLAIRRIWQRVAEDYAPFNVDVTTARPASFGSRTAHVVITRNTDANGAANPAAGAGGVAYVNVFGTGGFSEYRPAWVYHNNLANNEGYIAEATSHEVGHNLGLSHDGTTSGSEYYNGHGTGETSWGPLMGTGYDRNMSLWSKGEYFQANNQQDDLATIAGKLNYRSDDHGNSAVTATALLVTGGNTIVSTTPANDPDNDNPANKGVIERNTDVDVFSFVTGDGPISLVVNPWIVPSATTRGGNLDVRLQLYDELGKLIKTVETAGKTGAEMAAMLTAGRYFLFVSNAGFGDPLSTSPSGYTSYGSIGQYFVSGFVTADPGVLAPPVAEMQAAPVSATGQAAHTLNVTYNDDSAVKTSTLDGNDLRVTGPNGFSRLARFVSVNVGTDGTPRVATYAIDPPNGNLWQSGDNGTYTVTLQPFQVSDTGNSWALSAIVGQFKVAVPVVLYSARMDVNPGWTLQPEWAYGVPLYGATGPATAYTGTKIIGYNLTGNYPNRLANKYATTPSINTTGAKQVVLRFRRWLRVLAGDTATIEASTNNATWVKLWDSQRKVADLAWQEVQYPLPAGFAGSPSVRIRWVMGSGVSGNDIGWNIDDVEVLSNDALDAAAPQPALAVANLTVGGSPSHACSVTYTDATAVRLSSLDAADLVVTGPNGFTGVVEFTGADLPDDGSPITATYSIGAPGGTWDAADNGTYQIALVEGEVTDTLNNAVAPATLGSFTVNIPLSQQAIVVNPVAVTVPEGGTNAFTVRLAEAPAATVTVTTLRVNGDASVGVQNGATLQFTAANWSTPVPVTLRAEPDADQENSSAVFECRATGLVPVTVLVTKEDAVTGVLGVTFPATLAASGPVGGPFSPAQFTYALTNSGAGSLDWSVTKQAGWLSLSATAGTLAPQTATNLTVAITAAANALAAGTYNDVLGFTNLTGGAGNTTRAVSLTVNTLAAVNLTTRANVPAWGSVSPASGSFPAGSQVELRATPATYFTFQGWRGDVTSTQNPLPLVLSADRSVEGVFAEIYTTTHPTPHWWLASYGYTNDFENAVLLIGTNGYPVWQSYIAGLNPNDPASKVILAGRPSAGGTAYVLNWSTVSNRVYSIFAGLSPAGQLGPLPGATNLPWTVQSFTNTVEANVPAKFYQLRVEKP